ncbi:MAG: hypothetical protein Kow0089_06110 [Desulfobulbaceae bacterium]
MNANGSLMRLTVSFFLFSILVSAFVPGTVEAGNRKMMEQNARELVLLNAEILEQLDSLPRDGHITLSGDVVHRDGRTIIRLHELREIEATEENDILAPETFAQDPPYQRFLREESLGEIPEPTGKAGAHTSTPSQQ